MELGEQIKLARRFRKWTQQRLADEIGLKRGTIVHIEKGTMNPSMATLQNIAKALGCQLTIRFVLPGEAP